MPLHAWRGTASRRRALRGLAARLVAVAAVALALAAVPGAGAEAEWRPGIEGALGPAPPRWQPLSADAAELLEEARFAVNEAYGRPEPWTPDHPGWREGLAIGRRALQLADHPDVHRFLGRTYGLVGWSIRSLAHFDVLLEAGEILDDPEGVVAPDVSSRSIYAAAAADLGFARYGAGDLEGAIAIYERSLAAVPDDMNAVSWLGRLHLERGDPFMALPYWERLAEAVPDDEAVAFYLAEARRGAAIGPEASSAYRRGLTAYEAGSPAVALEHFEAAVAAAPTFADAAVWAGRTALELDLPVLALPHWERVVELRPDDAGAAYFLRLARDLTEYGITAGRAFHDGLTAYQQGESEAAVASFEAAVGANAAFLEAWVWLARVRQEIGRYDASVTAWERVLELDPGDARARYFLNIARQQRGVAAEAGVVFAEGIAAFEASDLATAEARFAEAARIDPNAVQAWVWLGRVAFSLQRFEEAAEAYGRAAALAPDDDDIAFFAAESAALAAPEEPDDEEAEGASERAPAETEDEGDPEGPPEGGDETGPERAPEPDEDEAEGP
jgi:tetratricopeptide (TPR) repeat protein